MVLVLGFGAARVIAEPGVTLRTLDGAPVRLSDYRGQWLVLNYWASWCKPCREEMPALDVLDRAREDVAVLGLAWEDTTAAALRTFLERVPVGYPIVAVDPFQPPAGLEIPQVLPTTLLIGPGGKKVARFYGPVSRDLLEQAIVEAGRGSLP